MMLVYIINAFENISSMNKIPLFLSLESNSKKGSIKYVDNSRLITLK